MDQPSTPPRSIPFKPFDPGLAADVSASHFRDILRRRRSVREFSDRPVSEAAIAACIEAAGSAPSGANKQPWRFVAISNPSLKSLIREAAEAEEREFYSRRAPADWLKDLTPLGTDWRKPFLETAPWLVAVFKLAKDDPDEHGTQGQVYYVNESVGIAVGFFLAACHFAGLSTLTHTPSPMGFLTSILNRPSNERAYLLIPVGYAAEGCRVPDIHRKPLDEIAVWHRPST